MSLELLQPIGDMTDDVLDDVWAERAKQDKRWGVQSHADTGGHTPEMLAEFYDTRATYHKRLNDERVKAGCLGWDGVLLEEVYEALAETDPEDRREELVQVAAVAVAMIEHIDRRDGE